MAALYWGRREFDRGRPEYFDIRAGARPKLRAAPGQAPPLSRRGFCSHPSYEARHSQKRRRILDLRQMPRRWKGRSITIGDGASCSPIERSEIRAQLSGSLAAPGFRYAQPGLQNLSDTLPAIKGKQNADRRGSPCFTLRRSAHPAQGALACRRSTAALPLGLAHPKVRLRTMFRGASAYVAGVSRRRSLRLQRAPRMPVIVPAD